tara:strand:+ start:680 stop:985 length:306 start_codon:yes stop_codon:yes gene_type:complete
MIAWFLLVLFVFISLCLAWYVKELLKRFRYLSDNSFILREKVERYRQHLRAVYELPTFYGDDTMRGLMAHTQDLVADLQELEEVFFLAEVAEEEYYAEEEE